jgi:hypothetical protein
MLPNKPRGVRRVNCGRDHAARILVGTINWAFLDTCADGRDYSAGWLPGTIAEGLLELHPSGGYVVSMQKDAQGFA